MRTICSQCDTSYDTKFLKLHVRSKWHKFAREIRALDYIGESAAAIARKLKLSKAYVSRRLREEEDAKRGD